ncbi:MAG: ABC transporter substrate-binding protein [Myxococcota bacterium]
MLRPSARALPLALALLAGCEPTGPSGVPADRTLTVALAVDPISLDPADVTDAEAVYVTEQIFEHLVRYKPGTTEIEPALATSWDESEDGTAWTFHLRPGVRFHDGVPLDADAVVFSLERQRDPAHPQRCKTCPYWESIFRNIQRVEKVDAMTVRLVIDRPHAPFLANLAMAAVSIVRPSAGSRPGAGAFATQPVGTGPFRFVRWIQRDRLVLEANESYWDGAPRIRHLVFRIVPDARARLVGLESGAIDVAQNLDPSDLRFVPLHPDLRTYRAAGVNVAYLAMNTRRPPWNDVHVRRAVNHAINREAIVKLIYQGFAKLANGPLPPSMWGYRAGRGYDYDPARARALLGEARPSFAKTPRLLVMDSPRPYLPSPERVARIVARNLADVGVPVEIAVLPWEEYRRRIGIGDHDLCLYGWIGDNGDPDNFLYVLLDRDNAAPPALNVAFYDNAELHGLLVWGRETSERAERERLYQRAQEIIEEEAPWVPLAHAEVTVAARKEVRGIVVDPDATSDYARVFKTSDEAKP